MISLPKLKELPKLEEPPNDEFAEVECVLRSGYADRKGLTRHRFYVVIYAYTGFGLVRL